MKTTSTKKNPPPSTPRLEMWECPVCADRSVVFYDGRLERYRCQACTARCGRVICRKPIEDGAARRSPSPVLQFMWGGVDLRAELHRLLEFCPEQVQARPPALVLHHVAAPRHLVGLASTDSWTINIWLWSATPMLPLGSVLATLVHEIAHFCAPADRRHGELFRTTVLELARDGYGVVIPWDSDRRIARLDWLVEYALCEWHAARDREAMCKG